MTDRQQGALLVGVAAMCWSLGGLIARLVGTDPWTTVLWRSVFAALFLLGATVWQERAGPLAVFRRLGGAGVAAAAGFAIASTCFIMALARTTVANVLVIQSTSPFIASVLGWLVLGERVRARTWAAMAVALAGTAVMVGHSFGAGTLAGDGLALVTALAFAAATVVVRRRREVRMTAAVALAAAMAAALAWAQAAPLAVSAADLALLAFFGCGQLGLGMLLFTAGARRVPVAEAALIAVLESVLGPLWVWLAVGERPGAPTLVGGAVVLAALAVHTALDLRRAVAPARVPVPSTDP